MTFVHFSIDTNIFHCFKGTWDLFYSGVIKHANKNIALLKEKAFNKLSGNRRHSTSHWGATWGSTKVRQKAEGMRGRVCLLYFPWEGMGKAVQTDLGLASLSNFSPIKEVVEGVGF